MAFSHQQPTPDDEGWTKDNLETDELLLESKMEAGALDLSDTKLAQEKRESDKTPYESEHGLSNTLVEKTPPHEPILPKSQSENEKDDSVDKWAMVFVIWAFISVLLWGRSGRKAQAEDNLEVFTEVQLQVQIDQPGRYMVTGLDIQCGGSAITEPETVTMTVTETVTATATVTLSLTQHDIPPSVTELH
jgi:hypothetical protein